MRPPININDNRIFPGSIEIHGFDQTIIIIELTIGTLYRTQRNLTEIIIFGRIFRLQQFFHFFPVILYQQNHTRHFQTTIIVYKILHIATHRHFMPTFGLCQTGFLSAFHFHPEQMIIDRTYFSRSIIHKLIILPHHFDIGIHIGQPFQHFSGCSLTQIKTKIAIPVIRPVNKPGWIVFQKHDRGQRFYIALVLLFE